MKAFGIVTLICVTAAAPTSSRAQAMSFATSKSIDKFADCFSRDRDRNGAPWAFVPKEHGGIFSNAGARAVDRPYFLLISDRDGRREIQLRSADSKGPEARAVNQCI